MNIEQTKEAIAVMQAYVDGKKIQYKKKFHPVEWADVVAPHWLFEENNYRIKPEVVSYRRFLYERAAGVYTVGTVTQEQNKNSHREGWAGFIRWIDNDWIEEEV